MENIKHLELIESYLPKTGGVLSAYSNDPEKKRGFALQLEQAGPLALAWAGDIEGVLKKLAVSKSSDILLASNLVALQIALGTTNREASNYFFDWYKGKIRLEVPFNELNLKSQVLLCPVRDSDNEPKVIRFCPRKYFPYDQAVELQRNIDEVAVALDLRHLAMMYFWLVNNTDRFLLTAEENLEIFPGNAFDHIAICMVKTKIYGIEAVNNYYVDYISKFPARQGCPAFHYSLNHYENEIRNDLFEENGRRRFRAGSRVPFFLQDYYLHDYGLNADVVSYRNNLARISRKIGIASLVQCLHRISGRRAKYSKSGRYVSDLSVIDLSDPGLIIDG